MSFDNLPSWRDGAVAAPLPNLAPVVDALSLSTIDDSLHIAMSYSGAGTSVSQWREASGLACESGR